MSDLINTILNQRYQLTQKLGQGGFGMVWQAIDQELDRLVAIKLLLPEHSWSEEDINKFKAEARLLAKLEHPNILRVYDVKADIIEDKNLLYLVTELATGGTLADRLQTGALPLNEVQLIFEQICQAIDYIHRAKVLHLDLTSSNIAFAKHGQVLVMDFGMAKLLEQQDTTPSLLPHWATLGFVSPEQKWNDPKSPATDIFALGIILHHMLIGKLPKQNLVQDLIILDETLSPKFKEILTKATQVTPSQRYQSAHEFFTTFKRISQPMTIPAVLESPFGSMRSDSQFYIEREADKLCRDILSQPQGETIVVKGPRQVGRSSFMHHALAQQPDKACIFIDFQKLPQTSFDNPTEFFMQFCLMLSDSLHLPDEVDKYWQSRRPDTVKCERYLAQHILPQLNKPLILALDEVDKIFNHAVSTDFFAMLRGWHNNRAYQPEFGQITLFLSISTEPHLLIPDLMQSPFNVGTQIILEDFDHVAVQKLNKLYRTPLTDVQVDQLMAWLSGHPFLTRSVLYNLATKQVDWLTLQQHATQATGLFSDYLRRYYMVITEQPDLKKYLQQVCAKKEVEENHTFYRLKSVGLIKKIERQVVFRNQLYARYFEEKLNVK